jgi:diguanylate cyclase (GGDEF)-like protein
LGPAAKSSVVIGSAALAVVAIGSTGLLGDAAQQIWDGAARVAAGAVAATVCLVTGRPLTGPARRWRVLMGAGFVCWALGQALCWAHDALRPGHPPAFTVADIGLLALPVCAFAALLAVAGGLPRATAMSPPRDRIELVLDSVLVTVSLLALTWSTVLVEVARVGAHSPLRVTAAVAYPVADLLLVIMILLLLTTRPATRAVRRPLLLAGAGLLALACTDGFRVAVFTAAELSAATGVGAIGAGAAGPGGSWASVANAGHVLGPVLVALAALCPPADPTRLAAERVDADRLHLLLPYVPVIATGVMIAVRTGTGGRLTPFEAYLGWAGLGLVVARQMFTIVDNTALLARVSEGRRRLHHQAYHDPLTGLANRALFRERLVLALEGRLHPGRPMAVLFADLDDFKAVNDGFGHAMGDRLLQVVGERLAGSVRRGDTVARLGGDEFAVLLERRPGDAESVGRRILAALREPFLVDGHQLTVSASVGLVVPDPADETLNADALLRRADAAMYAGKRRGKGALVRYAEGDVIGPAALGPAVPRSLDPGRAGPAPAEVGHRLAQALAGPPEASGLAVHYQPIVRLSDGATVAVEALARWADPVIGVVEPDVFVTIAERTGLVEALDDVVLDRACADAAALAVAHGRAVDVHVNVSAARLAGLGSAGPGSGGPGSGGPGLEGRGLARVVGAALRRHAVPASRLVVEITETRRIPDLPRAAAELGRLRELGVRVALDDFGSGYNVLARLHALPVDIVKLDATLTDVDVSPDRAGAICRSLLTICAGLGILVVAEGVETPERAEALTRLGCPLAQGHLFGQAEPVGGYAPSRLATAPSQPSIAPPQPSIAPPQPSPGPVPSQATSPPMLT